MPSFLRPQANLAFLSFCDIIKTRTCDLSVTGPLSLHVERYKYSFTNTVLAILYSSSSMLCLEKKIQFRSSTIDSSVLEFFVPRMSHSALEPSIKGVLRVSVRKVQPGTCLSPTRQTTALSSALFYLRSRGCVIKTTLFTNPLFLTFTWRFNVKAPQHCVCVKDVPAEVKSNG